MVDSRADESRAPRDPERLLLADLALLDPALDLAFSDLPFSDLPFSDRALPAAAFSDLPKECHPGEVS
jgi:hypothetical protein